MNYLGGTDDWKRASEVAVEIDSKTDYTRRVLNGLNEEEMVQKKEDGDIIGTYINGDFVVLDTKSQAQAVVRRHSSLPDSKITSMSLEELRSYVAGDIGEYTGPITKKVWYKRP